MGDFRNVITAGRAFAGHHAWTPLRLPNPIGVYNSDQVTLTSGKVSTWEDLSTAGRHLTQATAGNRPTQATSVRNGHSAVRFTAANSTFLQTATFAGIAHPITWWLVCKLTSQAGVPIPFDADASGSGGDAIYPNTATDIALTGGATQISTTFNMTADFASYVGISNGTSSSLRANGAQIVSGATTDNGNITQIVVGAFRTGGSNYVDGDLLAFGAVKGVPSGADLARLERYLRSTYLTW